MYLQTRRSFLKSVGRVFAGVTAIQACYSRFPYAAEVTHPALSDHEYRTLVAMAYDISPYTTLSRDIYRRVAQSIGDQVNRDPAALNTIRDGIRQLDAMANGKMKWLSLGDGERHALLENIAATPFFSIVRNTTVRIVYRENEVWDFLGYGGSSIEHGGYLNHGFDDIDWLPAVN